MATTRTQSAMIFTRALAHARVQYAIAQNAGQSLDPNVIARHMWDRDTRLTGVTYRDYQTEARRALRSVEYAHQLRAQRPWTGPATSIPYNYGIRSNESEYQYRVVVNSTTNGRLDPGGTMVIFGSSSRLDWDEAVRRATQMFERAAPQVLSIPSANDRRGMSNLGGVVVSVSRFESA